MVSVFHVTNEEDRQRLRHDIGRLSGMKQSALRSWKKRKGRRSFDASAAPVVIATN
jgi:hypothetical protein